MIATKSIDNSADQIDSRDVIARIEYLADAVEECAECKAAEPCEDSDHEEYRALKTLAEEAEGYAPDWTYGATLIRESYFVTYAQELAEDIGAVKSDAEWPARHIDWEAAADELKQDYTEVEFDGVTYLVR